MPLLNVTDLTSYLYCPRKFYLEKIKGIRKAPNKAMVQGKLRHEVIEIFSKNEQNFIESFDKPASSKEITLSYFSLLNQIIKEIFCSKQDSLRRSCINETELKENILVGLNQDIILRSKAIEDSLNRGFLSKELWNNLEPKYYSEFSVESDILGLKGKIDRVMISKNQIIPFELKTRQVDKVYETDELQLTAYGMLLEDHFKQQIPEGILESGNKKHEIVFKDEMKQKVRDLILEIKNLSNPKFPSNFAKCQNCSHKTECDELE